MNELVKAYVKEGKIELRKCKICGREYLAWKSKQRCRSGSRRAHVKRCTSVTCSPKCSRLNVYHKNRK